jgi:hypothetical protein
MKMYRVVEVFLTSTLDSGEWLASRSCRFTPGERVPGAHWIGDWVGPRTSLTTEIRIGLSGADSNR